MTIKELRIKSGIRAMKMAQELGIHLNTYYAIEQGEKILKPLEAMGFAYMFGVDKSEITPNVFCEK